MALFTRDFDHQIGRGEVAEGNVEAPVFIAFLVASAIALLVFHAVLKRPELTLALAVSMVVFGLTFFRVEWGVFCLIFFMMLSPEIDTGTLERGQRPISFRYDDILIIVIFLGVLLKQAYEAKPYLWRPSPINGAIYLYFGICLFSTALAWQMSLPLFDKRAAAFTVLKMLEYYLVFWLVATALSGMRQARRMILLFFVVSAIVSAYGLYSRFSAVERVSAPFETGGTEPNTLGGYLVVVMCLGLAIYTQAPTVRLRTASLLLSGLAFFPFLYTLSRASYLALIVGILVTGLAARRYSLIAAVIAILIVSPFVMPEDVLDRVNYTFQRGAGAPLNFAGVETGLQVDKSTYERIYVWEKVRYNLRVWPWLGGGVTWSTILDSQYARVLIETGLTGFAAFLLLQWRIIRTTWESFRWSEDWLGRAAALAGFSATFALIAHSMGTISFLIVRIMEPYWFIIALAVVSRQNAIDAFLERNASKEREKAKAEQFLPEEARAVQAPVRS